MINIDGRSSEIKKVWPGGMEISPCGLNTGEWYFADIHLETANKDVTAVLEVVGKDQDVCICRVKSSYPHFSSW